MYSPTKMMSLLLASWFAAQTVHGSPSPREPKTMFGYPIEEVPHALRTPLIVRTRDLDTLSSFGRLGNVVQQLKPQARFQNAVGSDEDLRLRYFAYEAEKRWQLHLIYRGMMEDSNFLECMSPCLNLPLPVLLQMQTTSNVLALFFCGTKCQEKTGQDRGIAFPYVARWLPRFDEGPAWHDLSQEHAPSPSSPSPSSPSPIIAKQAQPVFGPHPSLQRLARPDLRPFARWANSWQSWQRAVLKKMPAMEREVVAGEQRVGVL
ncbi:MAG: hypothetical protein M1826_000988 [Phylliscum demangeonii]|nr:MAG: hypothetical protein M1826_000988 [Phylliscum demangeonii]